MRGLGEEGGALPGAWFWQDPAVVLPQGSSQTDGGNPDQVIKHFRRFSPSGDQALCVFIL